MSKEGHKQPGLDGRHRDNGGAISVKRDSGTTMGMRAFEKISAVEGVRLTDAMRREATTLSAKRAAGGHSSGDHFRKK